MASPETHHAGTEEEADEPQYGPLQPIRASATKKNGSFTAKRTKSISSPDGFYHMVDEVRLSPLILASL
jgi:hypothetical protein